MIPQQDDEAELVEIAGRQDQDHANDVGLFGFDRRTVEPQEHAHGLERYRLVSVRIPASLCPTQCSPVARHTASSGATRFYCAIPTMPGK